MPEYDPLTGDLCVCTMCGAIVHFNYMTVHTKWHEGRWQEPVEKDLQNYPQKPTEED